MWLCIRLCESCLHVAAVLFKVEPAVRLGYTKQACTSVACYWNGIYTKGIEPAPASDQQFYSSNAKESLKSKPKGRKPSTLTSVATPADQQRLLSLLVSDTTSPCAQSVWRVYGAAFKPQQSAINSTYPAHLCSLFNSTISMESSKENLMASINSITKPQYDLVEKNTTKQSNTTLWHDHRAGRVTASTARLPALTIPRQKTLCAELQAPIHPCHWMG